MPQPGPRHHPLAAPTSLSRLAAGVVLCAWACAAAAQATGTPADAAEPTAAAAPTPGAEPPPVASPSSTSLTRATLDSLGSSLRGVWASVQSRFHLSGFEPTTAVNPALAMMGVSGGHSLRPRSLQLLPDPVTEGGFRATAGLVRNETSNWWTTHSDRYGSMSSSYQRLNASGVLSGTNLVPSDPTVRSVRPYLGAGYSGRLTSQGSHSPWRFNADLGLLSLRDNANTQLGPGPQVGDRAVEELVNELRLRPTVKVSVGYSF